MGERVGSVTGSKSRCKVETPDCEADARLADLESHLHAMRRGHFRLYLSARQCRECQLQAENGMTQEEIHRMRGEVEGLDTSLLWLLEDELEECAEADGEKRTALTDGIDRIVAHSRLYR